MRAPIVVASFVSLLMLVATHARAGEEKEDGQSDLDQAIETKLSARSVRDLNVVITQCETALDKV